MPTPSVKCCEPGKTYIYGTGDYYPPGGFFDIYGAFRILVSWSSPGGSISGVYNKCVLVNGTGAFGPVADPVDCPCCPAGYDYIQPKAACMDRTVYALTTLPIPCIECVCIDPPPFECPENQTTAVHTDFTFDFTEKYCVNCNPHGYVAPKCGANFIPTLYYDPSYIFKLKNKNLL